LSDAPAAAGIREGRATLDEHRRLWRLKPSLAAVYRPWFRELLGRLDEGARVLEVGAGPGFLAAFAREARPDLLWLSSDLIPAPWNDVAAEAGALPVERGRFDAVVAVDALHHLPAPRPFFQEAGRALGPGGWLLCLEPWITPLSFPIYRYFHQEACTPGLDPWEPFAGSGSKQPFDGDAALPWRLVRDTPAGEWRGLGFEPPGRSLINGLAYLLSLGFRERSLLPLPLVGPLQGLDRALAFAAPLLALRALLSWRRLGSEGAAS
jgi:SAM-dependent methyltransferase